MNAATQGLVNPSVQMTVMMGTELDRWPPSPAGPVVCMVRRLLCVHPCLLMSFRSIPSVCVYVYVYE